MPYLSAYRENTVGFDISSLESDVEVKNTSTIAVPRSGAIIRVDFETDQGRSLLLDLHRSDNGFIPLGANVLNEQGLSIGAVGQAGRLMSAACRTMARYASYGEIPPTAVVQ